MPLFQTLIEFKPVFAEDLMIKGLVENRKLLEQKVEETKALLLMRETTTLKNEPPASPTLNRHENSSPVKGGKDDSNQKGSI